MMERPEHVRKHQDINREQVSSPENISSEESSQDTPREMQADDLSIKSEDRQPTTSLVHTTGTLQAEQVSVRRVQANFYTNSAEAFTSASSSMAVSLSRSHISPALPATTPLISSATADIKNLSAEDIIANVVIDEETTSSKTISQQNAKTVIVQQQVQINAGVAVILPPKIEIKVAALTAQLKDYYQRCDNKIKRIFGDPLDIDQCFVNLAIVKNEEQKQNEKDKLKTHPDRTKIYSSYEDIYSTKEKEVILPQNLFKERKNKIPRRIAIIGRAGIGKSTLSQYLSSYLWALNNCWQDKFDVVIKIQLRNLTKDRYDKNPSLADIVNIECTDSSGATVKLEKAELEVTLKTFTNRTLVILDGWDEFNLKESPCAKAISDLMRNPHISMIVSSRPYANLNPKDFDLLLECIGFTTENIPEYINRVCEDKTQVPLIIAFLKRNPAIHSMAHIPIILDMICAVWDEEMSKRTEPITMTELYSKMIAKLWKAYMEKQEEQYPGIDSDKLQQKKEKAKEFLSLLAFMGMKNNSILLSYQQIEKAIKIVYRCSDEDIENKLKEILAAGFLNTSDNKHLRGDYYFPHLTFQEYFAAHHIAQIVTSKNSDDIESMGSFLIQNKFNPRFTICWCFVSGILKSKEDLKSLQLYFDILVQGPIDIFGIHGNRLLLRCLEECKNPQNLTQTSGILATAINNIINTTKLQSEDEFDDKYSLLPALILCPNLVENINIIDMLLKKIFQNNDKINSIALHIVIDFGKAGMVPHKIVNALKSFAEEYKSRKKLEEYEALSKGIEKLDAFVIDKKTYYDKPPNTPPVQLQAFTISSSVSPNNNEDVESLTGFLLKELIITDDLAKLKNAIHSLITMLEDEDKWVCGSAAHDIGAIYEQRKSLIDNILIDLSIILPRLLNCARHQDGFVRCFTVKALSQVFKYITSKSDQLSIMTILCSTACNDSDKDVREYTFKALININENNDIKDAVYFKSLSDHLTSNKHQNEYVKVMSLINLYILKEGIVSIGVFTNALKLCKHDETIDRALRMLVIIIEKYGVNQDIIEFIAWVTNEGKSGESIRCFGKLLSLKISMPIDIMKCVLSILNHRKSQVKCTALKALYCINTYLEFSPEVIEKIIDIAVGKEAVEAEQAIIALRNIAASGFYVDKIIKLFGEIINGYKAKSYSPQLYNQGQSAYNLVENEALLAVAELLNKTDKDIQTNIVAILLQTLNHPSSWLRGYARVRLRDTDLSNCLELSEWNRINLSMNLKDFDFHSIFNKTSLEALLTSKLILNTDFCLLICNETLARGGIFCVNKEIILIYDFGQLVSLRLPEKHSIMLQSMMMKVIEQLRERHKCNFFPIISEESIAKPINNTMYYRKP